jgi:hypothetical protein
MFMLVPHECGSGPLVFARMQTSLTGLLLKLQRSFEPYTSTTSPWFRIT